MLIGVGFNGIVSTTFDNGFDTLPGQVGATGAFAFASISFCSCVTTFAGFATD